MKRWLPYALGAVLVAQFAGLGVWQISRAQEKRAAQEAFDRETGFTRFVHGMEVKPYQQLSAEGRFDAEHQFLLDNIIVDSHYGYYVLTPLVYSNDEPALIVNRGWIEKTAEEIDPSALALPDSRSLGRVTGWAQRSSRGRHGRATRFTPRWTSSPQPWDARCSLSCC
jgi:surfeit locus 1 family protein